MQQVKKGDCVTIEYEGTLQDGQIFETTSDVGPLEFKVGDNEVMPAFEETIVGMAVGETRTLELSPEQAYGQRQKELVQSFAPTSFDEGIDPKPGMVLGMNIEREGKSERLPGLVTEVGDDEVTIDFNHPLAGQTLIFKITLQEINENPNGNDGPPAPDNGCSSGCTGCN
ncbi:MAG: peptidylprolyl isomerase [Deltaproteobacteria bacterium]